MNIVPTGRLVNTIVCGAFVALLAGCQTESVVRSPSAVELQANSSRNEAGKLDVCHDPGNGGNVINTSVNAWPALRAHGDYATDWYVDHAATSGDGIHFTRISDALAAVDSTRRAHSERSAGACRITVHVASGNYTGSFTDTSATLERLPLLVVVPDVSLTGAYAMHTDANNRATGASDGGSSALVPSAGAGPNDAIVVVATDGNGYHGDRADIRGFRFTSGYDTLGTTNGGIGVGGIQVHDLTVAGNKFDRTLNSAVDNRASTATISGNFGRRLAVCGMCFSGPGSYTVSGNRLINGGFTGVFIAPVTKRPPFTATLHPAITIPDFVVPSVSTATALVENNDVRDYVRQKEGYGSGVRLVSFSADAPDAMQSAVITLRNNTLYHNNFAIDLDANTPLTTPPAGTSNVSLALEGNAVGPSCKNNVFVAFTRISKTFGTGGQSYLNGSTYRLTLNGNTPWSAAWYDSSIGVGDHLYVDGVEIPSGKRTSPSDNPAGC